MNIHIQQRSTVFVLAICALLGGAFAFVLPALAQTDSTASTSASSSTSATATSSKPAIVGQVTEQEFQTLLDDAQLETDTSLKKYAVAGTVIALGPGRSGRPVVLLETKNGSTTLLSMATKTLVIRDDGTTTTLDALQPGMFVVITTDTATVRQATVTRVDDGSLVLAASDGTEITIGTSSNALFARGGQEVDASVYTGGDAVILVEGATSTTIKDVPVLAVVSPKVSEVVPPMPESTATETAPTTTPENTQNSMFLWIVLGIAVIILLLGYFLARRGRSTPTDY